MLHDWICVYLWALLCVICCSYHMLSVWPNHYPYLSVAMALV